MSLRANNSSISLGEGTGLLSIVVDDFETRQSLLELEQVLAVGKLQLVHIVVLLQRYFVRRVLALGQGVHGDHNSAGYVEIHDPLCMAG